jgi:hypothetical protein
MELRIQPMNIPMTTQIDIRKIAAGKPTKGVPTEASAGSGASANKAAKPNLRFVIVLPSVVKAQYHAIKRGEQRSDVQTEELA